MLFSLERQVRFPTTKSTISQQCNVKCMGKRNRYEDFYIKNCDKPIFYRVLPLKDMHLYFLVIRLHNTSQFSRHSENAQAGSTL